MLLSHSSKKCCIDADINYLGKAGKLFPTGIHLSFIIWFSHWGRLNTPVTAWVLLMMMWPNLGNVQNQSECMSSAKGRGEQSELLGRLRNVAFHPRKLHAESSKYKQELKAKEGCRAEPPVRAVIPSLFIPLRNDAAVLLCHPGSPHLWGTEHPQLAVCVSEVNHRAFSKVCDMSAGYRLKRRMLSSHVWVKLVIGRVLSEIIYMIDSQDSTYCSAIFLETPFQTLTLHQTSRKRVIFDAKQVAV